MVLAAFAVVAALRAVPYLAVRLLGDPAQMVPVGYEPRDFLQYVAFLQSPGRWHHLLMANPFTTDPQDGRFIALGLGLLAEVRSLTGIDAFLLLELARVPALLFFAWSLWRFLPEVLEDLGERTWACLLVALSGGVGFLVAPLLDQLPEALAAQSRIELRPSLGWSTFEAAYNPLWLCALGLLLLVLGPLLSAASGRSPWRSRGVLLQAPLAFLALWFTHPYTALVVPPILLAIAGFSGWLGSPRDAWPWLRSLTVLGPPVAVAAVVARWQLGDPVYALSSGGALGSESIGGWWYLVTWGVPGLLALKGWQLAAAQGRPGRHVVVAWVVAVGLLHSSPLLNGYHFVFLLHLPLCLAAAPAAADLAPRLWARARGAALLVGLLAVGGALSTTVEATLLALAPYPRGGRLDVDQLRAARLLATLAPGRVLCPGPLGNVVAALAPHRVYLGHWFLTPHYLDREQLYLQLLEGLARETAPAAALRFLRAEAFDYLVVPAELAEPTRRALPAGARVVPVGSLAVVIAAPGR